MMITTMSTLSAVAELSHGPTVSMTEMWMGETLDAWLVGGFTPMMFTPAGTAHTQIRHYGYAYYRLDNVLAATRTTQRW
jgi:hypothetical protein